MRGCNSLRGYAEKFLALDKEMKVSRSNRMCEDIMDRMDAPMAHILSLPATTIKRPKVRKRCARVPPHFWKDDTQIWDSQIARNAIDASRLCQANTHREIE
jgi:hypothetical protein